MNIYEYINYLFSELPQIENINEQNILDKYLPLTIIIEQTKNSPSSNEKKINKKEGIM